jgi:uncharacterized protein YdcH (DUF465 family)
MEEEREGVPASFRFPCSQWVVFPDRGVLFSGPATPVTRGDRMDQELIAYLDRRFGSVDERFESIDQRFVTMDQRLKDLHGEMNTRFDRVDQRFEKVDQRFEKVEETAHLTQIMVEGLRDDVRLTAEGVMGFTEILDTRSVEIDGKLDELKASIGPAYKSLEKKTDSQVTKLSRRVAVLEGPAKREKRDIL